MQQSTNPENKPEIEIQKITFSKKEQQEINDLLERQPSSSKYRNGRGKISPRHAYERLKREYYHGVCCLCQAWPDYKVIYDYDGAKRIQYYCFKHYHDAFIKSKSSGKSV